MEAFFANDRYILSYLQWRTDRIRLAALRRTGRQVDDEALAHIWPTRHENVHFYGTHSVDIDGELAQLDTDGYRPLRLPG